MTSISIGVLRPTKTQRNLIPAMAMQSADLLDIAWVEPSTVLTKNNLKDARGGGLIKLAMLAVGAAIGFIWSASALSLPSAPGATGASSNVPLASDFQHDVAPLLLMPQDERTAYAVRLQEALDTAKVQIAAPQFIVLVDRSPSVQAALLYWGSAEHGWNFIGATPVSTGLPGRYEHFVTPLGVFSHSMANPDFRAEGTKNKLGFRGYGIKGMRVYDFGWVDAPRGWGDGAMGVLRLQMHSTDPALAAPRLGTAQSEGCVRIPAALNDFVDRHALLDQDYEELVAVGTHPWVLRKDSTPTLSPGRYLVVVDSERKIRPDWSPLPKWR
ncbi:L,D-transpeptidase [Collimonas sp. NPDC087041]|uniref:L,D-transpeptidase n=1 Tax=Collimonas sp. NPDC087041 TaxID=3363960 RepID=UPI00382893D0